MITRHRSLVPFALGLAVAATIFLLFFYSSSRSRAGIATPRTVTLRSPKSPAPARVNHRGASASSTAGSKTQHNEEYYDDQFYEEGEGEEGGMVGGEEGWEEGRDGAPRAKAAEPVVVISNPSKGGKKPPSSSSGGGGGKGGGKRAVRLEAVESEADLGEVIEAPPPVADSKRKQKGGVAPPPVAAPVEEEVATEEEEEEKVESVKSGSSSSSSSSKDSAIATSLDTPKPPPGDAPPEVPSAKQQQQQQQQQQGQQDQPPSLPRKVDARPPRKPPAWLLEGHCSDPLEQDAPLYAPGSMSGSSSSSGGGGGSPVPRHAVDWSANSGSHEEHTGDTLLGECTCPLQGAPPADGWSFDCGDYDWRILSDLAPWHGVSITHEMLDTAFNLNTANVPPGYHFSIHGGKVFVKVRPDPMNVYHGKLLDMMRTVAAMVPLPDCEFVMHAWDHAKVWRQDPIPVFSYIRDAAKTDVTIPYTYKWSEGAHDFDLGMDASCPPNWGDRSGSKVAWRGGCTGPATGYHDPFWETYLRYRATSATKAHPDVLDAGLVEECVNPARAGKVLPSLDLQGGACHQKFLLLLDGNTASGRSSHWIHAGAVLLKPDSVFSEWWYHLLRPWVHYVPVREYLEDLVEQSTWLVKEAPPSVHTCLANNLKAFAKKHVRKEAVACYWWRLLTVWAEKQGGKSRTEGFQAL